MARLISLTGKMGSGKTTAVNLLREGRDSAVIKFAQPLYDIQAYIYQRTGLTLDGPKDRKLLQWLGTDWGRSKDENLWANIFRREVEQAMAALPEDALILNDDTRFDNEAALIKELGGTIIEIVAPESVRASRIPLIQTGHASEAGVAAQYVDHVVYNNGSLLQLDQTLREVLRG